MECRFCQSDMVLLRTLQGAMWACPATDCGAMLPAGAGGDDYQYRYIQAAKLTLKLAESALEKAAQYAQEKQNPSEAEGLRQVALRCRLVYREEKRNKWFKQALGEAVAK